MLKELQTTTLLIGPAIPAPSLPASYRHSGRSGGDGPSLDRPGDFNWPLGCGKKISHQSHSLAGEVFDPKIRVIIVAILDGLPNVLTDGQSHRSPSLPASESGQSTLTIKGEDINLVMDLEHHRKCYPAMPSDVRVCLILLKYFLYGPIPLVSHPVFVDVDMPTARIPVQSGP